MAIVIKMLLLFVDIQLVPTVAMGCSCSRPLSDSQSVQQNALQMINDQQLPKSSRRRRQEEKRRQRQRHRLQKGNGRIQRHGKQQQHPSQSGSQRRSSSNWRHNSQVAMRLLGGSNGSSATECGSALYARTVEKQREDHHRIIEKKTLYQLDRQLETFLLNQVLLGMQFFSHFESEMSTMDQQLQAKRRASAQLLSEHSLLHASVIDVAVQVKFGGQPLQKPLTYVVFENVDIARTDDANYDSIAALCKVLLDTDYYKSTPARWDYVQLMERARWMGYVRLKLREQQQQSILSPTRSLNSFNEDIDGGIYTDGSSSSGYSTADSWKDYDHVYMSRLNNPRPLKELRMTQVPLRRNVLPDECISQLAKCLPPWLMDDDDDDDDNDDDDDDDEEDDSENEECEVRDKETTAEKQQGTVSDSPSGYETVEVLRQCRLEQQHRRTLLQQSYLSSTQFMNYFGELFRQHLAKDLHIPAAHLASGSYRGCTLMLDQEMMVPAIHVPHGWPDCAFEFNRRTRPVLTNLHTGEKFQWPTEQMRQRIKSFGFHVIPEGHSPKHRRNPFRELEWRIVFPQAEIYLERQLNQMQLKVFLLMKLLVRTFVGEQYTAMGSLMEQLRAHLFWHCESNTNEWPEEFLGEQLVRFVRTFADCLARKELRDYFIKERNLLEHVPEDALMQLHTIMAGIAEHPLLHMVEALKHLQHHKNFYPPLDYNRLLENIFTEDYIQLREWSKFKRQTPANSTSAAPWQEEQLVTPEKKDNKRSKEVITDAQGWLGLAEHQERSRGKLRRKTQRMQAAQQMKLLEHRQKQLQREISVTSSVDNLDLQLLIATRRSNSNNSNGIEQQTQPQFNNGLEILRRTNLLELLLDHLLSMLRKAIAFRNCHHSHLYLEQGQRLCRLYQQLGCSQHAQHFVEQLCEEANNLEKMETSPMPSSSSSSFSSLFLTPPTLPSRSVSPQHPRKSIKFDDHVVLIHSPPQHNQKTEGGSEDEDENKEEKNETIPSEAEAEPTQTNTESVLSLGNLLQRLNIQPDKVQTLTQKTDQLMQTLAPESKREELRHMVKRNAQKLKEALN
ncbi:uncharacterized protein LOC6641339 [Drosophila willistoni]|uniref:uncharacterized protein LOC6641339 n=1 Tax=Drosophila willistoni TaxID=7260 RepID=UPI000C26D49E|nr:uncharacterized protein LOC6641339 [Drosophila willistoni]